MASKKQKADPTSEFREAIVGSVARVETKLDAALARQIEDRLAIQKALEDHMDKDAKHFEKLYTKHERTDKVINYGIGGLFVLEMILGLWLAVLAL